MTNSSSLVYRGIHQPPPHLSPVGPGDRTRLVRYTFFLPVPVSLRMLLMLRRRYLLSHPPSDDDDVALAETGQNAPATGPIETAEGPTVMAQGAGGAHGNL